MSFFSPSLFLLLSTHVKYRTLINVTSVQANTTTYKGKKERERAEKKWQKWECPRRYRTRTVGKAPCGALRVYTAQVPSPWPPKSSRSGFLPDKSCARKSWGELFWLAPVPRTRCCWEPSEERCGQASDQGICLSLMVMWPATTGSLPDTVPLCVTALLFVASGVIVWFVYPVVLLNQCYKILRELLDDPRAEKMSLCSK